MTCLETIIRSDPDLMGLLDYLREMALPQWRLVSGCLYQTVWNVLTRRPRGTGIQDYDVIYFDAADLSWEAEDAVIRRATRRFRCKSAIRRACIFGTSGILACHTRRCGARTSH